jgi:hypothetical protein
MRTALKELRKQRTLLNRAIRALEELETLQSSRAADERDLTASTSDQPNTPGEIIIFPGDARCKLSRSSETASERKRRTR